MKPTEYNQAIGDYICSEIAAGNSLRRIMARDGMPELRTWFRWLRVVDGLRQQYENACEDRAYSYAEDIVDIADDDSHDTDARGRMDGEWVARSKLRVSARQWVASRLLSKYRDKQDLTSSDGSMSPQPVTHIERVIVKAGGTDG